LVHKFWSDKEVDREKLIEELADFMAHMGNLANFLGEDLIANIEEVQTTAIETIFNRMAYLITTLNWNKRHAKYTLTNRLLPAFLDLVYSLKFNLEELEQAYKAKMENNYQRFQ
jgi:NTP pyrophosphatase (non-canonical NTP hydrolase)